MHYDGTTYRPPVEADTLLLQVTVGCAHNKCTYCDMYRDVCFKMEKLEQIEEDLKEARNYYNMLDRIFLVNGDAFVLKADYLKDIVALIKKYFPECETISMYASIQNIKAKTDKELLELRAIGVNDLYVGVESGLEEAVANIRKGHTIEEAKEQLQRLNKSNIKHRSLLMLGVAGKGKGEENAKATAEFLNYVKPDLVWVGTLCVFPGTELSRDVDNGSFIEASEIEILQEEKILIENLQLDNVPVYGVHPSNAVHVAGIIPKDKEKMLKILQEGIDNFDDLGFSKKYKRSSL